MNYEDTKKAMLLSYPRLFVDEIDVLHHLFFVNGNGYYWENGQLTDGVESVEEQVKQAQRYRGDLDSVNPDYHPKNATIEEVNAKEIAYRLSVIEELGDDCWFLLADGRIGHRMYPICQYAKIVNIPNDIQSDWLDAAKKAITLARSDIFRTTNKDREWLTIAEQKIESLNNG